jgi:hypothetical protein
MLSGSSTADSFGGWGAPGPGAVRGEGWAPLGRSLVSRQQALARCAAAAQAPSPGWGPLTRREMSPNLCRLSSRFCAGMGRGYQVTSVPRDAFASAGGAEVAPGLSGAARLGLLHTLAATNVAMAWVIASRRVQPGTASEAISASRSTAKSTSSGLCRNEQHAAAPPRGIAAGGAPRGAARRRAAWSGAERGRGAWRPKRLRLPGAGAVIAVALAPLWQSMAVQQADDGALSP